MKIMGSKLWFDMILIRNDVKSMSEKLTSF